VLPRYISAPTAKRRLSVTFPLAADDRGTTYAAREARDGSTAGLRNAFS
jgi:hypothetical protein